MPADAAGAGRRLFAATAERFFIAIGLLIGLAAGPLQAAARTLLVRLAPRGRITQFFGLFALSGKVTSFSGPLLVGARHHGVREPAAPAWRCWWCSSRWARWC